MLHPVTENVFRWMTPDPADAWMMVGHLVLTPEETLLIDPPLVPGLPEAISNIGKPSYSILTTLDHVRGSRYLASEHGIKLYVPLQEETTNFDPSLPMDELKGTDYIQYDDTTKLPGGLKAIRARPFTGHTMPRYDEMALLTTESQLLTGDIASGTSDGRLMIAPEMFNPNAGFIEVRACFDIMANIILSNGATTLLSSHWHDIRNNLQQAVERKGNDLSKPV